MMVEPPCEPRIGRVLEIDDGVFVPVEKVIVKQLRRFVRHAREFELSVRVKLVLNEAAEESRRGRTVETMVVIKDSHPHEYPFRYERWKTDRMRHRAGPLKIREAPNS